MMVALLLYAFAGTDPIASEPTVTIVLSILYILVAGVVIAGLLIRWQHWLPAFLTLGFGAATLGAFLISSTVGLLGVHATWEGFYVFAAAASEIVCIVVGGLLLLRARDPVGHTFHARAPRAS